MSRKRSKSRATKRAKGNSQRRSRSAPSPVAPENGLKIPHSRGSAGGSFQELPMDSAKSADEFERPMRLTLDVICVERKPEERTVIEVDEFDIGTVYYHPNLKEPISIVYFEGDPILVNL